jgi:hypothetical protein
MANKLTPPQPTGIGPLDRWLNLLWRYLNLDGQIDSTAVSMPAADGTQDGTLLYDWFNTASAGQISGGTISAVGTNITVTAGVGLIKVGSTPDDNTVACDWDALGSTALTDSRVTWVCVDYNAGSPQLTLLETTTSTEPAALNYNSCFPLGYCVREGSTVHVTNNPRRVEDAIGGLIRRFHQTLPLARDELVGGLMIGETGTRNITLSSGYLFDRQNRFTISAINTSSGGSFDAYYRDGVGGFTKVAASTQWPNTQYDNGSGTLATLGANKYANLFWYLELDGNLVMVYGRTEYNTAAAAALEALPSTLPLRTQVDGRLIARTTFKKSDATLTAIDSVFSAVFTAAAVTTHNNLSSLQGGTTGEYYHLTSAEYAALGTGGSSTSNLISTPTTIATDTSYIVMSYLTITSDLTVNGNLGVL